MSERPKSLLEVDDEVRWNGPFKFIALGILCTFAIGVTIFAIVGRLETGDAEPTGFVDAGPDSQPDRPHRNSGN